MPVKPAGAALDKEQQAVLEQLRHSVEYLNRATDMLAAKGGDHDAAMRYAEAVSLLTIAKLMVMNKADELNMTDRLPALR
jgi:hypothetical protein